MLINGCFCGAEGSPIDNQIVDTLQNQLGLVASIRVGWQNQVEFGNYRVDHGNDLEISFESHGGAAARVNITMNGNGSFYYINNAQTVIIPSQHLQTARVQISFVNPLRESFEFGRERLYDPTGDAYVSADIYVVNPNRRSNKKSARK